MYVPEQNQSFELQPDGRLPAVGAVPLYCQVNQQGARFVRFETGGCFTIYLDFNPPGNDCFNRAMLICSP